MHAWKVCVFEVFSRLFNGSSQCQQFPHLEEQSVTLFSLNYLSFGFQRMTIVETFGIFPFPLMNWYEDLVLAI